MNFNSVDFFVFLILSLAAFRFTPRRYYNVFFTLTGFYFYSFWSIKFTLLLVFSSIADYFLALRIERAPDLKRKKLFLIGSVAMNLCVLGFFKYFNFFIDNVHFFTQAIGLEVPRVGLQVVLPVGISFYTFQEMSYTIDVYRGQCRARTNYFDVAAFIAFFPQLVAGPIERAGHLMDQLENPPRPSWDDGAMGLQLVLWGLFQKVVIADNVATIVNYAFDSSTPAYDTGLAVLGAYAFAVQIYCDFAGYTDIARGVAKFFGIDIMRNFNKPYFAVSIRDFWSRWHISLSTWLKDYLYIPLGGSRGSPPRVAVNLMITMLLGGLWHGATWMFVLWGGYHGLLLVLEHRYGKDPRIHPPPTLFHRCWRSFLVFQLVCFSWVLFRSANVGVFVHWLHMFFSFSFDARYLALWGTLLFYSLPLLFVWTMETCFETSDRLVYGFPAPGRVAFAALLLLGLVFLGAEAGREFIYFQF